MNSYYGYLKHFKAINQIRDISYCMNLQLFDQRPTAEGSPKGRWAMALKMKR